MNKENTGSTLAIGFIIAAAASRLIPHIPNFTAMESLALFSGAYLGWRVLAFLAPFVVWYASDLIINNTISRSFYPDVDGIVWYADYMPWVYISALFILFLGAKALRKWRPTTLAISSVVATLIFFVLSNFGTWMSGVLYPKNLVGLTECYIAALPFFKTSLISNLVFTAVFFGGYELVHYLSYKEKAHLA